MQTFSIGDILAFPDGDWMAEGIQGGCLRLRNIQSQQVQILHVTALPQLMQEPSVVAVRGSLLSSLESLSDQEAVQVRDLAAHVEEVVYGVRHGVSQPRPEYDPELTGLMERQHAKILEFAQMGKSISPRTMQRWVDRYRKSGPAGLVDGRRSKDSKPVQDMDERLRSVLLNLIAQQTNQSTISVSNLIANTKVEVLRIYPGESIQIPSDSTMRRHIKVLTKGKYTSGNAANRRSAANAPNRMFSARPAIAPGHEVQIDSSPFDVLVAGDDGKPIRAQLTIMLDKATQSIIATSVNVRGTKGVDLAFLLAQCLTPRQIRPSAGLLPNELELARMPWAQHLLLEEVEQFDQTRPFIKPQRIMTDNGMDYRSATFLSACEMFGIDVTRSAVRTPTDKPNVERAFHTIKTKFVELLPGSTGGSVDRRGTAIETHDLLDIHTLAELFDRWVSVVWQNMRHESLRDPMYPQVVHTPNSMYMAMFDMTGFVPVPLSPDDYIALLPSVERSIQMDGIQVNYRRYDSPLLHPYRLQPSPVAGGNGKWTVHHNPHNPGAVWVKEPESSTWIECTWMNKDAFSRPFSAAIRKKAREITQELGVLGDPESTQATIELIGSTRNAMQTHERRRNEAQTELKLAERLGKSFPKPSLPVTPLHVVEDDDEDYEEFEIFDPRKVD